MPRPRKAGVDWNRIYIRWKGEYLTGKTSLRAIGREEGVSHKNILGRAKREGWAARAASEGAQAVPHPAIAPAVSLARVVPLNGPNGKLTPVVRDSILTSIKMGEPPSIFAPRNGITAKTFYEWVKDYPDFAEQVAVAETEMPAQAVKAWREDIGRGNAPSAIKYLERNKLTRDDFAPANSTKAWQMPEGVALLVAQIPIPGSVAPPNGYAAGAEPLTINHEPEPPEAA